MFENYNKNKVVLTSLLLLFLASVSVVTAYFATRKTSLDPRSYAASASQNSIYWGALIDGNDTYGGAYQDAPWDFNTWDKFEANAGKRVSILTLGSSWWRCENGCGYKSFNYTVSQFDRIRSRGAIPLFTWQSATSDPNMGDEKFQLIDIINGDHDAYINQFARESQAWGHPYFLKFDWEMNGNWYPWSEQTNGNKAGEYAKMWRHTWNIFNCVDDGVFHPSASCIAATNVNWVWCVNTVFAGSPSLSTLYPGDSYVDWVAIDGYNKGNTTPTDPYWQDFTTIIKPTYDSINTITANSKPIMIAETASTEAVNTPTANKALWIKDTLTNAIPNNLPNIKAVVWFNWNINESGYKWPFQIESSPASQSAFASGISSSFYASNTFGTLAGPKISPISSLPVTVTAIPTLSPTVTSTPIPSNTPTPKIPLASPTAVSSTTPTIVKPTKALPTNGLTGTYFDNIDFTGTQITRNDTEINFYWGIGSPQATISNDTFSVRWQGYIVPQFTGEYTFYARSDDGVRLSVNNKQIINDWVNRSATQSSGKIKLEAGKSYPIKMEYYENTGIAVAQLYWSSSKVSKQIIPKSRFFTVSQ